MAGWVNKPGAHRLANRKEELFAQYYVKSFNATQSARRAGWGTTYGSNSSMGGVLLKRSHVIERIDYLLERKVEKEEEVSKKLQEELLKIALANPTDFLKFNAKGTDFTFDVNKLKSDGGAVNEISLEIGKMKKKKSIKLNDKLKAIELLLKQMDDTENARLAILMEKHIRDMAQSGSFDDEKAEDDGFIEALNDVADNMENDEFVITEGINDLETE